MNTQREQYRLLLAKHSFAHDDKALDCFKYLLDDVWQAAIRSKENIDKCRYQCGDFCLVESLQAATAKTEARIKELEKELAAMKDWEITLAKYAERANHWEQEARKISLAYDYAEATIAKREAELAAPPLREGWVSVPTGWSITKLSNDLLELKYADVWWCFVRDTPAVQDKMGAFVYEFLNAMIAASEEGKINESN